MHFADSITDLQAVIDFIPNAVVIKNRAHRIVLLNNKACEFLGHDRDVLLSRSDDDLYPADEVHGFHAADDAVFASGLIDEREEVLTDGQGTARHVVTRKKLVLLNGTEYLIAIVSDVTGYREAEALSRYLALHDVLTGLANRALFKERVEHALPQTTGRCALLLINLDHFRKVNELYGIPTGDELLVQFGNRLSAIVRPRDTVARLGGNTFSILLAEIDDDADIEDICTRVLNAGKQLFELSGAQIAVTASIGVVLPQLDAIDSNELYRRGDVALYQAKDDGRDCWCAHSEELDRRFEHRRATESDLRAALATGTGIEIHYQPLATIVSGEVIGFEALARWRHPTRGLVMPDEFISVAEACGLIVKLGEIVLRRACADAAAWLPSLRVSVNVSPMQFVQGDFVALIEQVLADSGLDPVLLELEITEGVLIDDANGTLATLNRIRALGVSIVLDDFGTGFSSLSYLRHFPFDKVKIDKSFIADMMTNREAASIVEAVLALAKSLHMGVVAEGVETPGQFEMLRALGCTQAQGYLIGRPQPMERLVGSLLSQQPA